MTPLTKPVVLSSISSRASQTGPSDQPISSYGSCSVLYTALSAMAETEGEYTAREKHLTLKAGFCPLLLNSFP